MQHITKVTVDANGELDVMSQVMCCYLHISFEVRAHQKRHVGQKHFNRNDVDLKYHILAAGFQTHRHNTDGDTGCTDW